MSYGQPSKTRKPQMVAVNPAEHSILAGDDGSNPDSGVTGRGRGYLMKGNAPRLAARHDGSGFADVDTDLLSLMPRLSNAAPAGAIERAWETFQRLVGIENESGVTVLDYAADTVRINRDTFEMALTDAAGEFAGGNGRYFPLILPTLADPFEVWLVPFASERGRGGLQTVVLDRSDEGWLWRSSCRETQKHSDRACSSDQGASASSARSRRASRATYWRTARLAFVLAPSYFNATTANTVSLSLQPAASA